MFGHSWTVWIVFNLFILAMLALDLGVFHRAAHTIRLREALGWTAFWIIVAFGFAGLLWIGGEELGLLSHGRDGEPLSEGLTALDFLTAYVIEKSLSMDNIFVFLLIFRHLGIPPKHQHDVLFWGILGALVMRLAFILAGVALLHRFEWVAYIFGAVLLFTGIKMALGKVEEMVPDQSRILRLIRRVIPVTPEFHGRRFLVRIDGKLVATPLLVALVMIETTDVIFAVDSVPAVLAVTHDAFIAYTSNVFAILGLRALYFALAGVMELFKDLHYGLAFILVFIGGKMIAGAMFELPDWMRWVSLAVIALSLGLSIAVSMVRHRRELPVDMTREVPEE